MMHVILGLSYHVVWVTLLGVTLGNRGTGNFVLEATAQFSNWQALDPIHNETRCFTMHNESAATAAFVHCTAQGLVIEPLYELNVMWMLVGMLAVAGISHQILSLPKLCGVHKIYRAQIDNGVNVFRWADYMITNSLAAVIVASLVGISDVHSQVMIFLLSVLVAGFGFLGEITSYLQYNIGDSVTQKDAALEDRSDEETGAATEGDALEELVGARRPLKLSLKYGPTRPVGSLFGGPVTNKDELLTSGEKTGLKILPHLFGVVAWVAIWSTILDVVAKSNGHEDAEFPAVLLEIAVTQAVFSFCKQVVQWVSCGTRKHFECEVAFLLLNFVGKATLAIMVLEGLLQHPEVAGDQFRPTEG